ncbi:carbonic anhydrase [Novosphingobium cyanobacteriorum]|uniref:carbonic anhydrase n=1 Tax=Novosphingobium cyanobacteriorum TaxID=3024215 RepID=A0ABT6CMJ8_9SPHN|nr:carbonic anhydrase [Novosphingobium cyanobacteriorum]MDF8335143.1 carbonic anhydrase [Novosphingobium cyanobacteriorum]
MQEIPQLLLHNRAWAAEQLAEDPEFFTRRLDGQKPAFLWIGCSDSRVQPDHFTQAAPGGLFVHRNIANLVRPDDANLMAVLDFAVMTLGVNEIVICGHYGCGGIAASLGTLPSGPVGHWLSHVVDVLNDHRSAVECLHDHDERVNRLVEINVRDQLLHLAQTPTVQAAFAQGRPLTLHGWVYDLRDGLIKPLLDINAATNLEDVGAPERVLV